MNTNPRSASIRHSKALNFTKGSETFSTSWSNKLEEINNLTTDLLTAQFHGEVNAFQVKMVLFRRQHQRLRSSYFNIGRSVERMWFQAFTAFTMFTLTYKENHLNHLQFCYYSWLYRENKIIKSKPFANLLDLKVFKPC